MIFALLFDGFYLIYIFIEVVGLNEKSGSHSPPQHRAPALPHRQGEGGQGFAQGGFLLRFGGVKALGLGNGQILPGQQHGAAPVVGIGMAGMVVYLSHRRSMLLNLYNLDVNLLSVGVVRDYHARAVPNGTCWIAHKSSGLGTAC